VTFPTKAKETEASNKQRQKEVRRAVLLIKRARESPPADVTQKIALWKLEQAIPDDIKREAYDMVSDSSGSGIAERISRGQDLTKDKDVDKSTTNAQPATEDAASLLREITSQTNVIEAMAADLQAAGLEVTEGQIREYLASVDFDAVAKQAGKTPA
jgi:hypothetical protein